jgi:hypothetical protein
MAGQKITRLRQAVVQDLPPATGERSGESIYGSNLELPTTTTTHDHGAEVGLSSTGYGQRLDRQPWLRPNVGVCAKGTTTYWKSPVFFCTFSPCPWRGKLGCRWHSCPHSSWKQRSFFFLHLILPICFGKSECLYFTYEEFVCVGICSK